MLKALYAVVVVAAVLVFDTQLAWAGQSAAPVIENADRLYANREDLQSAERAAKYLAAVFRWQRLSCAARGG